MSSTALIVQYRNIEAMEKLIELAPALNAHLWAVSERLKFIHQAKCDEYEADRLTVPKYIELACRALETEK